MNIPYLDLAQTNNIYTKEFLEKINKILNSGRYLSGEELNLFQAQFSSYLNIEYTIGVANGYDALTIILLALKQIYNWSSSNEIIVPSLTFFASAGAIIRAGLKPVFCDVNVDGLIDYKQIIPHITSKTSAILAVHLYGKPCNLDSILQLIKNQKIVLIEDAAQAHGAQFNNNNKVGTKGIASAFSFYPGKNLGAFGDAGAIVTNNKEIHDLALTIANYGSVNKYYHNYIGLNSRLDEIQAAILQIKLKKLDFINNKRKQIANLYFQHIHNPCIFIPRNKILEKGSIYHTFPIYTKNRQELKFFLQNKGIETLIHYPIPLHKQKCFIEYNHLNLPNSEKQAEEELSLPIHSMLTYEEVLYICHCINSFK